MDAISSIRFHYFPPLLDLIPTNLLPRGRKLRDFHLHPLSTNPSPRRLLQNILRSRGPNSADTHSHNPQQIIQSPDPTCSLDLHIACDMLLHQFKMRNGSALVVVIPIRLLDEAVARGGLDECHANLGANLTELDDFFVTEIYIFEEKVVS